MSARPRTVAVFSASSTLRRALREALALAPDLSVVVEGESGATAADTVEAACPDLVVLDSFLPDPGGHETARAIMARRPTPILMITDRADDHRVLEAMAAGAVHVSPPPPAPGDPGREQHLAAFLELLRTLAGAPSPPVSTGQHVPSGADDRPIAVVGIVSSAGGPQALLPLLSALPHDRLPPILLVQHIVPGFAKGFAEWLAKATGYPVRVGEHGMLARRGELFLAPDGCHLSMDREARLVVDPSNRGESFRPSGDRLLAGLAEAYGVSAVGIVLSGMGKDGAGGAVALHEAGGRVLVQADAAIDGMPRAVLAAGVADATLPVAAIASWLRAQGATP